MKGEARQIGPLLSGRLYRGLIMCCTVYEAHTPHTHGAMPDPRFPGTPLDFVCLGFREEDVRELVTVEHPAGGLFRIEPMNVATPVAITYIAPGGEEAKS